MSVILSIRKYGDPVLREAAKPVTDFTPELGVLAENMIASMRDAAGVGLAAQQVGRTENICVIEIPADYDVDDDGKPLNPDITFPLVLVNPRIVEFSKDTETMEEGCLSFPKIQGNVKRAWKVTLEYSDLEGHAHSCKARGFFARAVQHELDHLKGDLFIDHLSHVKRLALRNRLQHLKEDTLEDLSGSA